MTTQSWQAVMSVGVAAEWTFVIADLSGFTAAVDVHGDDTAADLAGALERAAIGSLGAKDELVKSMGDAVLVACAGPAEGLAFLGALFDRFGGLDSDLPLLRAGAHQGSAVRRGDDYFGSGVNVAARVADLAAGCQILATDAVDQVARAAGIGVVELGPYELRNVAEPVAAFEIDCGHDVRGHTIDPVCRMRVPRAHAAGTLRHDGVEHWFCSLDCVGRFAAHPARYSA